MTTAWEMLNVGICPLPPPLASPRYPPLVRVGGGANGALDCVNLGIFLPCLVKI